MTMRSVIAISCFSLLTAASAMSSAQQVPPRDVTLEDAGSEPPSSEDEDAGAESNQPRCIEHRCDDAGVCTDSESNDENCDAEDQIYERRVVVPPAEGDVAGCGCSWYQMSSLLPLGLLGFGVMLGGARRSRKQHRAR